MQKPKTVDITSDSFDLLEFTAGAIEKSLLNMMEADTGDLDHTVTLTMIRHGFYRDDMASAAIDLWLANCNSTKPNSWAKYLGECMKNNPLTISEELDPEGFSDYQRIIKAWNKTNPVRPWHDLEPHIVTLLIDTYEMGLGFDGPHVADILKTKPANYEAMDEQLLKLQKEASGKEVALADPEPVASETWQGVSKPHTVGPVAIVTVEAPTAPTETLTVDAPQPQKVAADKAAEDLTRYDEIVAGLTEANRRYVEKQGTRGVFDYPLSVAVTANKKGVDIAEHLLSEHAGIVEVWLGQQRVTQKV